MSRHSNQSGAAERGEEVLRAGDPEADAVGRDAPASMSVERRLREAEEKYRSIFEHAIEGIFQSTPDGRFIAANPALARMFGYDSPAEMIGRLSDIERQYYVKPGRRAEFKRLLDELGVVRGFESEVRGKDGGRFWIVEDVRGVRDPATDELLYYEGFIRDITESRRAEEALRESEERYRILVENANDIIYTHDLDGNYTSMNIAGERVTGYTRDEVLRMKMTDVLAPEYVEVAARMFARKLDGGASTFYEIEIIARDGRRVPLEVSSRLISEGGKPVGVQGIARDITRRRRTEERLRESEERYRELFENANDILYTHDLDGNFTAVNKAGERVTGYSRRELLGMNIAHLVTSEYLKPSRRMLAETLGGAEPPVTEVDILTRDGRRVILEVSIRLIHEGRRVVAIQGTARDVTEAKRSREALEESEERYALAAQGANDGLWDWDLRRQRIYFSPRWKAMLGHADGEIDGRPEEWFDRIHPEDAPAVRQQLREHLEGLTGHFENEHRMLHKNGDYRWMHARGIAVRDAEGTGHAHRRLADRHHGPQASRGTAYARRLP